MTGHDEPGAPVLLRDTRAEHDVGRGRPIDVAAVGTDHAERIREPGAGLRVAGIGGGLHAVVDEIGGVPEVS